MADQPESDIPGAVGPVGHHKPLPGGSVLLLLAGLAMAAGGCKNSKAISGSGGKATSSRPDKTPGIFLGEFMLGRIKGMGPEFGRLELEPKKLQKGAFRVKTPSGKVFPLTRQGDQACLEVRMPLEKFLQSFGNGSYTVLYPPESKNAKSREKAFQVKGQFPGYPSVSVPVAGATGVSRLPKIQWKAVADAHTYELQLLHVQSKKEIRSKSITAPITVYQLKQKLSPNTEYLLLLEAERPHIRRVSGVALRFATGS